MTTFKPGDVVKIKGSYYYHQGTAIVLSTYVDDKYGSKVPSLSLFFMSGNRRGYYSYQAVEAYELDEDYIKKEDK